jgi:hypothetical protein
MHRHLTLAALLSALAIPALAAADETPWALGAVHTDMQAQLEEVAARPDATGAAARAAADLMARHNAAQERLVLPLLGWTERAAARGTAAVDLPDADALEAEIARLFDGDAEVVTALVELYARAGAAGDAATARLAERMIWHQTGDVQVLYPAALLVAATLREGALAADPAVIRYAPGPLYGADPVPMMGIGDPHRPGRGN